MTPRCYFCGRFVPFLGFDGSLYNGIDDEYYCKDDSPFMSKLVYG